MEEFCGDLNGYTFSGEININSEDLTMEITVKDDLPEVVPDKKVKTDYFSNVVTEERRQAGPITGIKPGTYVISIDPRKLIK